MQAEVTIYNPKFVSYEDRQWLAEGYDACRTEQTRFSNSMEWCIASPSQLSVVRITQIPLVAGAHDAPPPGEDAAPPYSRPVLRVVDACGRLPLALPLLHLSVLRPQLPLALSLTAQLRPDEGNGFTFHAGGPR